MERARNLPLGIIGGVLAAELFTPPRDCCVLRHQVKPGHFAVELE